MSEKTREEKKNVTFVFLKASLWSRYSRFSFAFERVSRREGGGGVNLSQGRGGGGEGGRDRRIVMYFLFAS